MENLSLSPKLNYQHLSYEVNRDSKREKVIEVVKQEPVKIPLKFEDIYSSAERFREICSSEKHYWRTRDVVLHKMYEDRQLKILLITNRNVNTQQVYRTIVVNLELLYKVLEMKASENKNEYVYNKSDLFIPDDAIAKEASNYLFQRLYVTKTEVEWPSYDEAGCMIPEASPDSVESEPSVEMKSPVESPKYNSSSNSAVTLQKMCRLYKLFGDDYQSLEVVPPVSEICEFTENKQVDDLHFGPFTLVKTPSTSNASKSPKATVTATDDSVKDALRSKSPLTVNVDIVELVASTENFTLPNNGTSTKAQLTLSSKESSKLPNISTPSSKRYSLSDATSNVSSKLLRSRSKSIKSINTSGLISSAVTTPSSKTTSSSTKSAKFTSSTSQKLTPTASANQIPFPVSTTPTSHIPLSPETGKVLESLPELDTDEMDNKTPDASKSKEVSSVKSAENVTVLPMDQKSSVKKEKTSPTATQDKGKLPSILSPISIPQSNTTLQVESLPTTSRDSFSSGNHNSAVIFQKSQSSSTVLSNSGFSNKSKATADADDIKLSSASDDSDDNHPLFGFGRTSFVSPKPKLISESIQESDVEDMNSEQTMEPSTQSAKFTKKIIKRISISSKSNVSQ